MVDRSLAVCLGAEFDKGNYGGNVRSLCSPEMAGIIELMPTRIGQDRWSRRDSRALTSLD